MTAVENILERLEKVRRNGSGWTARCPAHEDRRSSLSVREGDDGRVLINCFAGCEAVDVIAAIGLAMKDLFPERPGGGGPNAPSVTRATVQQSPGERGCSLAEYASAKGLPVAFLESHGISEIRFQAAPAVRFPYLGTAGQELCVRYRVSMGGDLRVRTKAGMKHCLYGLNRLRQAAEAGYVIVVEGESDTQTLWHAGFPALGLPGANGWNESRDAAHLEQIPVVYVVIEPDTGGEAVLRWLGTSRIRTRVRLVTLDGAKDASELYLADRDDFSNRLEAALEAATPWSEHEKIATGMRSSSAWNICSSLAREPRVLDVFAVDLARCGLAGERRAGKLLYLIFTSRLLPRPVSAAVKGPSSGGKSFAVEMVAGFFPADAYHALTAMSERALAYGTAPLSHRVLVLYEAAGLEGEFASYIVRSLLSEGRVRYETVEKTAEGLQVRLVEREGPTGLITTTTKVSLHPENETRLLSIPITDTPEQTKDVLLALADERVDQPDLDRWIALQEWLTAADENRVTVPFAPELARLIPPIAVRLRRDVGALLNLVRAHALLHQATRDRDERGWIIATLDDYAAVHEIIADLVSDGVEATVPETVRETVQAVTDTATSEGLSITRLAAALGLDKSVASRRWQTARAGGYLKNLEDRRGKPAKIVIADPLPEDVRVLPTPEQLPDRCTVAADVQGVSVPPSPANGRPSAPGDPGFLDRLFAAFEAGHVTEGEWRRVSELHMRLEAAPLTGGRRPRDAAVNTTPTPGKPIAPAEPSAGCPTDPQPAPEPSGLGSEEQAFLRELKAAFPGAAWVDDYAPGPAIEIDLRPLHLVLRPSQLGAELAEWGEVDYRCPACGERFVAASLFDAHRVSVPERPGGHRCLDAEELSRGGLVKGRRWIWRPGSTDRDRDPAATAGAPGSTRTTSQPEPEPKRTSTSPRTPRGGSMTRR